jgi:hypothetical protein
MNRYLPTGTVLLTLITAVPASAAHKHAAPYRPAPVEHLMPRPNGGVQQPRMLNPWICIGPCGQYSHPMPGELPFFTNPIPDIPQPSIQPPIIQN